MSAEGERERFSIRFGSVTLSAAAVIFDKDGVLFDQSALLKQLHALRHEGVRVRFGEAVARTYDDSVGVSATFAHGIDPHGPLAMAVIEHETIVLAALLYHQTGRPWLTCLDDAQVIFVEADGKLDLSQIPPLPGFPDTLVRLKEAGLIVGIVTGDQRARAKRQLAPFDLDHTIDFLAAGDDTPYCKPHARALLHWLEQFDVSAGDAVMVGDTANDWLMAKRAGAIAVAVRSMAPPSEEALITIDTIAEIALDLAEKPISR